MGTTQQLGLRNHGYSKDKQSFIDECQDDGKQFTAGNKRTNEAPKFAEVKRN